MSKRNPFTLAVFTVAVCLAVAPAAAAPGDINTVAGTGVLGFNGDGIPATTAQLWFPANIFVDGTGNIFITDRFNQILISRLPSSPSFFCPNKDGEEGSLEISIQLTT